MKKINQNQLVQINGGCVGLWEHQFPFLSQTLPTITPDSVPLVEPVNPVPPIIKGKAIRFEVAFI